jgi:hypothetical protein
MNLRILSALLLLMGAILAAVLFWPPADSEAQPEPPVVVVEGSEGESDELAEADHDSEATASTEREEVGYHVHKIGLEVLNHDKWKAVAHTKVYYVTDVIRQQRPELSDFKSKDGFNRLHELPSVKTNADGLVMLELPGKIAYLFCESEGAIGSKMIRFGSAPTTEVDYSHVLMLREMTTISVHVKRTDSSPAVGVPVVLHGTERPVVLTNENGVAELPAAESRLVQMQQEAGVMTPFSITCLLPLMDDPETSVVENAKGWSAEVTLSPYGSVEVVGLETGWDYLLNCDAEYAIGGEVELPRLKGSETPMWRCDFVPIASELEIEQLAGGVASVSAQEVLAGVDGPARERDVVRIDARKGDGCKITGKLLTLDAKPLANHELSVWFLDGDGKWSLDFAEAKTRSDGSFSIHVLEIPPQAPPTKYVWILAEGLLIGFMSEPLSYLLEDLEIELGHELAVGSIRPQKKKLVVAGEIVDESGNRLEQASPFVFRTLPGWTDESIGMATVDEIDSSNLAGLNAGEFRFEFSPAPFPCKYILSGTAPNRENFDLVVQPGTEDLTVILRQACKVGFTHQGNPDTEFVSFHLIGADGESFEAYDRFYPSSGEPAKVERGAFWAVPFGDYTFQARDQDGQVLKEITDLVIQKGAGRPSALKGIHLGSD